MREQRNVAIIHHIHVMSYDLSSLTHKKKGWTSDYNGNHNKMETIAIISQEYGLINWLWHGIYALLALINFPLIFFITNVCDCWVHTAHNLFDLAYKMKWFSYHFDGFHFCILLFFLSFFFLQQNTHQVVIYERWTVICLTHAHLVYNKLHFAIHRKWLKFKFTCVLQRWQTDVHLNLQFAVCVFLASIISNWARFAIWYTTFIRSTTYWSLKQI